MKVYFQGEIRGVKANERTDPETGTKSTKYRTFIEDEDGERLEVNSKKDFTERKGENGVAELAVYERGEGGGYWLTLTEFFPGTGIDISK